MTMMMLAFLACSDAPTATPPAADAEPTQAAVEKEAEKDAKKDEAPKYAAMFGVLPDHMHKGDAPSDALVDLGRMLYYDAPDTPDAIVSEFRTRLFDTQLFWEKYAGGKFANYLFHRHEDTDRAYSAEAAHHLVEEANLFIEAAHACHGKILETGAAASVPV